jgi:predicted nucleotidyltransferase
LKTTKNDIILIIRNLKPILAKYGVKEIGLFGSYVRDEATENSDIDILIDFDSNNENFDNYMSVYEMLEQHFANQRIEVVTKNGLSPYIGPRILEEVYYA